MNRLSNYFAAAKLAKLHLAEAEEQAAKDQLWKAVSHLAKAVREVLTAQNNIASIAFKPRKRVRP
jgi:hypothetical protein